MANLRLIGALVLLGTCTVYGQLDTPQKVIDYLAENIRITFDVETNLESNGQSPRSIGTMTMTNTGEQDVPDTTWEMYFCSVRIWEPDTLRDNPTDGKLLGNTNLVVYHFNGCLHKIAPTESFVGFDTGVTLDVPWETSDWQVSRTDISANWYFVAPGAEPKTIASTAGESLDFVGDFDTLAKWKRRDYDEYDPYTPQVRYERNADVNYEDKTLLPVIPTPIDFDIASSNTIEVTNDWVIVATDDEPGASKVANYFAEKIELQVIDFDARPPSKFIELLVSEVRDRDGKVVDNEEAYRIETNVETGTEHIIIRGNSNTGLMHGVHTILSLYDKSPSIQHVVIVDYPRYQYRGMHVDVARNFKSKETILKLLDIMAMYKMNKFHFHLTDDEGWRVEIPGLDELTEIGGRRCHDLEEQTCIIPELGSGPDPTDAGSGFYTVAEYREILTFANDRGIEVIPEVDMPGHGHAAIKAMEARYHALKDTDPEGAVEYLLSDLDDMSQYLSIQYFRDNAINPCLNSTERFVRKVVHEFKNLHMGIQPLKVFHFGGDEVAHGAWVDSPVCNEKDNLPPEERMKNFIYSVAEIVNDEGLDLAGWEDGLMEDAENPYDRSKMPNSAVYGYTWNNIWEWGGGPRAYILANNDFKVVIGHATDLYFDMPYEPDPEERGFYWATRCTETRNTFNYIPDSIYDNIAIDVFGRELTKDGICSAQNCVNLDENRQANVIGIQGHLWSETVRTDEQFEYMVYPRILAIAERGWHKASWEDILDDEASRNSKRDENWAQFANTLGYRELRRLDDAGIKYNVPLPGAIIDKENGILSVNSNFPGLVIQVSTDGGKSWKDYNDGQQVPGDIDVHLRTRSADNSRTSRTVVIHSPDWNGASPSTKSLSLVGMSLLAFIVNKLV